MAIMAGNKILPDKLDLRIDEGKKYKCKKCSKVFSSKEVEYESMPSNMTIAGLEDSDRIPRCPYCKQIAFFGFRKVK